MPEVQDESIKNTASGDDAVVHSILSEVPSVESLSIDVPSKCLFYNLTDGDNLRIRPMTFNDEKKMMSSNNRGDPEMLNKFLDDCLLNLDIYKLLLLDKIYLVMQIRCLSYGHDYDVTI